MSIGVVREIDASVTELGPGVVQNGPNDVDGGLIKVAEVGPY